MTDSELFALVKLNLRIMGTSFDSEINALIATAKEDIADSTGEAFDLSNRMECNSVVLFVRARFGEGSEKDWNAYQHQLSKLGVQRQEVEVSSS